METRFDLLEQRHEIPAEQLSEFQNISEFAKKEIVEILQRLAKQEN